MNHSESQGQLQWPYEYLKLQIGIDHKYCIELRILFIVVYDNNDLGIDLAWPIF